MKFRKQLYDLSDAGDYWHHALVKSFKRDLYMVTATREFSIFTGTRRGRLSEITGTNVDDTLSAEDDRFEKESQKTERRLEYSPRYLDSLTLAGIQIHKAEDGFNMCQSLYARKLIPLKTCADFDDLRSLRQKLASLKNTKPE